MTDLRAHGPLLTLMAIAFLLLRAVPGGASPPPGTITLASTSNSPAASKGNGNSRLVSISADGTRVAFESEATNLDPRDRDPGLDVYVKDIKTGRIILASTSASGVKGNSESYSASLSADGTKVAFQSAATNLDPRDHDFYWDIYVKDLVTGNLTLVSTSSTGVKGNGDSLAPAISADGTRVAFYTTASNLDRRDPDRIQDVYVKDLSAGSLALVSISLSGAKGDNSSYTGALSADGNEVVFDSFANDFDPRDTDVEEDVYAKNLLTGDLILASTTQAGEKGNDASIYSDVSADGTTVAFISYSTNLDPRDADTLSDVYVKDLTTGGLSLASITSGGIKGNSWSWWPDLSEHGTEVGFFTEADNLDPGDADGLDDIYVKDLITGSLRLVSTSSVGVKGNGDSEWPDLTPDASRVAFESDATNLDPNDHDRIIDSYVKQLG